MSLMICDCGGMICRDGCSDCQFKGNFKPRIMNDYKGFKAGDQVEITKRPGVWTSGGGVCPMDIAYPLRGKITNLFFDDCGIYTATISGYGFDIEYLIEEKIIRKLPKYAVGDVVRRNGEVSVIIKHLESLNAYLVDSANGMDSNWTLNADITPFDGFRIGDTVWTVKRGKGKVEATNERNRPWFVEFESDMSGCRRPKSENLIPTEAKYKEAMKIGEIVGTYLYEDITHKFSPPPTPDNSFFGKIQIAGCKRLIEELNSYKWPMPKFKKGDAVFYQGKKWEVISVKEVDGNFLLCPGFKYDINRQVRPNGGVCACCVNESDLRLWKETKITHIDNCEPVSKFADPTGVSSEISKMKYIGKHINGKDMFLQEAGNGKSVLWYGEKGDDIQ